MRSAARLLDADEGRISFCGKDITHTRGRELREVYGAMQMIFQMPEDSFDPRKTLGWSIAEPLLRHGWKEERRKERVAALLHEVGLGTHFAVRYPHEASGGECQRAAPARPGGRSDRPLTACAGGFIGRREVACEALAGMP